MPGEVDGGEADENLENQSGELEELRNRINDNYEEADDGRGQDQPLEDEDVGARTPEGLVPEATENSGDDQGEDGHSPQEAQGEAPDAGQEPEEGVAEAEQEPEVEQDDGLESVRDQINANYDVLEREEGASGDPREAQGSDAEDTAAAEKPPPNAGEDAADQAGENAEASDPSNHEEAELTDPQDSGGARQGEHAEGAEGLEMAGDGEESVLEGGESNEKEGGDPLEGEQSRAEAPGRKNREVEQSEFGPEAENEPENRGERIGREDPPAQAPEAALSTKAEGDHEDLGDVNSKSDHSAVEDGAIESEPEHDHNGAFGGEKHHLNTGGIDSESGKYPQEADEPQRNEESYSRAGKEVDVAAEVPDFQPAHDPEGQEGPTDSGLHDGRQITDEKQPSYADEEKGELRELAEAKGLDGQEGLTESPGQLQDDAQVRDPNNSEGRDAAGASPLEQTGPRPGEDRQAEGLAEGGRNQDFVSHLPNQQGGHGIPLCSFSSPETERPSPLLDSRLASNRNSDLGNVAPMERVDKIKLISEERQDFSDAATRGRLGKNDAQVQENGRISRPIDERVIDQGSKQNQTGSGTHTIDNGLEPKTNRNNNGINGQLDHGTSVAKTEDIALKGKRVPEKSEAAAPSDRASTTWIEPSQTEPQKQTGQLNSPEYSDHCLGAVSATAYAVPRPYPSIRFDVWAPTLEKATAMKMELGSTYVIKGKVGDVCNFETVHSATKTPHVNIFVPKEHRDSVRPGEKYKLVITSIEQKKDSTVVSYDGRNPVILRLGVLKSAGLNRREFGRGLVEIDVRNNSRHDEPIRRVFGKVEASSGHVKLNVAMMGARKGEALEILNGRSYEIGNFLRDFNASKPAEMKNVSLGFEGGKLGLEMGGKSFPFIEYRLSCKNLQAFLEAKLRPAKRGLQFSFDGEHIRPKFGDRGSILKFEGFGGGVFVYTGREGKIIASRIDSTQGLSLKAERFDRYQLVDRMTLTSKPEGSEGRHVFAADPSLHNYVFSRLDRARKTSDFRMEKGRMAEELCSDVLSLAGWTEVRRHPSANDENIDHPSRPGPDSIQQFKATGEMYLFEFRWFANVQYAIRTAELEAKRRYREWYSVEEVKGAYIAVLDWDRRRSEGILHVKRVWSRGD